MPSEALHVKFRRVEARASYEKALALTQQGTRAAIPAGADSAV